MEIAHCISLHAFGGGHLSPFSLYFKFLFFSFIPDYGPLPTPIPLTPNAPILISFSMSSLQNGTPILRQASFRYLIVRLILVRPSRTSC